MNIKTREQFDALLGLLRSGVEFAFDSETNGLNVWQGHFPISFSFYFPTEDCSFDFAFAHGVGEVIIPEKNKNTANFHSWKWTGKGKKQVYKSYWFAQFAQNYTYGNVPNEWVAELRDVWNTCVVPNSHVIYFNEPFDVHMAETAGLNQPQSSEDVRIAVSLVFEDWRHPSIRGENGLKWQANYWGIEGALEGEADLNANADNVSLEIAEYVAAHWDNDWNKSFHALKRPARVDEILPRVALDHKAEMWMLPSDFVAPYAEKDTKITYLLREKLLKLLRSWDQEALYQDWCVMQSKFLIRAERNGMKFDKVVAQQQIDELQPQMIDGNAWFMSQLQERWEQLPVETQERLTNASGILAFTCGSAPKLKVALTVLTGYEWQNANKESIRVFEENVGEHPAVEVLKKYRHAQRAISTYLKNWIKSVDENGYIHSNFNAAGPKTGRLSSSSGTMGKTGNGQNIPTRGFKLKTCIKTPAGFRLFQIDYAQLELRIASWVADCDPMIRMFASGEDMHAYTRDHAHVFEILFPGMSVIEAAKVAFAGGKLKLKEWVDDEDVLWHELQVYCRSVAKVLNFGLLYGGSWRMVNRLLHVGEQAARKLHAEWNALFPEFEKANRDWMALAMKRRVKPNGIGKLTHMYVAQPISGRTRKFHLYPVNDVISYFDPITEQIRTYTQNTLEMQAKDAFNFIVQGLGGYINSVSWARVCLKYDNTIFKPFSSIHDSGGFYLDERRFDILPDILYTLGDWPIVPHLTAELETSVDGTWQGLKAVEDLEAFITSGGKNGLDG